MTSKIGFNVTAKNACVALAAAVSVSACGDHDIFHAPGNISVSILAASATIETPANVVLTSGVLQSATTGSVSYGCTYNAAGSETTTTSTTYSSYEAIKSTARSQANLFTAPSYMKINSLTLRVAKVGGPTTNMYAELSAGSGTDPSGAALATSTSYPINSTITLAIPIGQQITFALPTAVEITAGGLYAVSLHVSSNTSLDGANNILWVVSNTAGPPTGCSDFPVYRWTSDSGATWGASSNPGYSRGFFLVNADQHAQTGTAAWILDAGRASAVWQMSTFTMSENPNGLFGGTITYDVGVGSSDTTATYSVSGQTKAQVQALSNLAGRYLYVRANFNVTSPGYDVAAVADGSVQYQ